MITKIKQTMNRARTWQVTAGRCPSAPDANPTTNAVNTHSQIAYQHVFRHPFGSWGDAFFERESWWWTLSKLERQESHTVMAQDSSMLA